MIWVDETNPAYALLEANPPPSGLYVAHYLAAGIFSAIRYTRT